MNRHQKIALVKRGGYIIKNDMEGDNRVLDVLNECGVFNSSFLKLKGYNRCSYYGMSEAGVFDSITDHELNNRPHYLMSELVMPAEDIKENYDFIRDKAKTPIGVLKSISELESKIAVRKEAFDSTKIEEEVKLYYLQNVSERWDSTQGFNYGVESAIEHLIEEGLIPNAVDSKEVFTVDVVNDDIRSVKDKLHKLFPQYKGFIEHTLAASMLITYMESLKLSTKKEVFTVEESISKMKELIIKSLSDLEIGYGMRKWEIEKETSIPNAILTVLLKQLKLEGKIELIMIWSENTGRPDGSGYRLQKKL